MNPTQHECPDCGYTWLHGQHGGHSCKDRLLAKIAEQARDIASKQATINGMNEAHWKVVQELAALKAGAGEVVAWQFFFLGEWHNGIQNLKDHRKNTEAAGIPTRDLYAGSVIRAGDGMCNADDPASRCICREEFGYRVCAPNHSEQVRQMVPDAFLEASRQADDVLTAIIRNNEPIATLERTYGKDWHEAVGKIRTALILQIAAAPSAGSQGGDA